MVTKTLVEELTTIPTTEEPKSEHCNGVVDETTLRYDSYMPPPLVAKSTIWAVGLILFLAAMIWPPLLLVLTYTAALIIPYSFRINDDATTRRHLIQKFEKEDKASAHVREIPADVRLKTKYWTNPRYV